MLLLKFAYLYLLVSIFQGSNYPYSGKVSEHPIPGGRGGNAILHHPAFINKTRVRIAKLGDSIHYDNLHWNQSLLFTGVG